jgi:GGDEF domain-containing protein
VRLAARVLPPAVAALGIIYALVYIFPASTGKATMVAGLFLAGLAGTTLARRLAPPIQRVEGADPAARLYDEESHLGNRLYLKEMLGREVARNARSGTSCTLVVFETRLVGSESRRPPAHIPEAGAFVGRTLKAEARGSDYVARVGQNRWAALLTDTDRSGAKVFASRVMRQLAAKPFTRGEDGAGLSVRARATAVEWRSEIRSADEYLEEALLRLDGTGPQAPVIGRHGEPAGYGRTA